MAEKQEFYKLVNDKTKVPRLTPLPQIDHLKSEQLERNPIQKFRAHALKLVKSKPPPQKATDKWKTSVQRLSKTHYTEELIKIAKTISLQGLLPEWEDNILKLIPKTSKRKHIGFLMSVMKEVRQDYLKEMKNLKIRTTVKISETDPDDVQHSQIHLKYRASSEDFSSSFSINKKLMSKKYFLSHQLIRNISYTMFHRLPKSFINFERYKSFEDLHIRKLNEMIISDIQKNSSIVQNKCYNEIINDMLRLDDLKDDKRLPKLLHCAESFMVQQILNSMMNSINSLIEVLRSSGSCAQLKLQLLCRNDTLEIEPSIEEIFSVYHQVIDNVTSIGQELVPLREWLKISDKAKYIKVDLPEWFLKEAHAKLQQVLEEKFNPLSQYYEGIRARFSALCSNATKDRILQLIASKEDYEVYCSEVDKFNAYLAEVSVMVANVYYNFGTLNQTSAINSLKLNTSEIINMLIKELIDNHQELNRSICMEFENLESRALTIPDDTKALFELTEYVSHASKVLIKELEGRIERSVKMLCSLVQIALLSDEHVELNKTTINWLELIKPVFSQHNIFCEAKKGELEDELQRKITVLSGEIDAIFPELVIIDDMDDAKRVQEYKEFLALILSKIKQVDGQIEWINLEEKLFKFPETPFPKVDEIKEIMKSFCSLVHIISQWRRDYEVWMDGPFEYLDAQVIDKKTNDYLEKITEMHRMFKVKIKSDLTANKPFKFSGIADDPDPMQQPAPLKLCWQSLNELNEFKMYVPLAICMCNPALERRHWSEMSKIAGINLIPNAGTTLRKIIHLNLLKDFQQYEVISIGANKELALQQKLNAMIEEWNDISFEMSINEAAELPVFSEEDRIEILLEEQFIQIMKMRASYFIAPIESKVVDFYEKLCCVRDTIEYWNCVQEHCKYLSSFFSNEIVQNHLEIEVDLYNSVNLILKTIEESFSSVPTFHNLTQSLSVLDKLKKSKYALELISSKVHDYFEQLRLYFTRLFFLSDSEIMQLLFEYQNLAQKKSQIQKCFPNISKIKMDKEFHIFSIIGEGGEELRLKKNISILLKDGSAADWLVKLNKEIISTIKCKLTESIESFNNELCIQWIAKTPAMVTFCIWQIFWTSQIHSCFLDFDIETLNNLSERFKMYKENAQQYLKLNLSRKDRETMTSLVLLFSNQEEVINLLIEKKVHEDSDFDWKAQIRFYYEEEEDVKVHIINTCIKYAYEYYSSSQRILVNTPLTERCYRSLMEAYYQNYFGTLTGFSCVGKTETIKNLARTVAVPFFVFSGDDRQDYNCIGNIFKGLVTFEAWVYFKNFTRIKEEILSVIAQYVFRISQSKNMNLSSINIDGTQLNFNPNCYITFNTNPMAKHLSNIPENLKLHFRTVCFMNPDIDKICQIELFAAGFSDAKNLATSLTEVYNLCKDQMSSEKQYNFNLRNLKSVILTAGKLKFTYPDEDEQILLFRSLIDVNISQFLHDDIVIFQSILNKSFPGLELPPPNHDNLLEAVEKICASEQLSNHDGLKLKIIQLYEMMHLRQTMILVGEPFSGKSTILRIFLDALLLMQEQEQDNQNNKFKISCEVINPGALSTNKIYGFVDESTGEWIDGICSDTIRKFVKDDDSKWKWLIFDGDMCSSWIEKLETAFDINQTLFLTSNEKIILSEDVKIFFETLNLNDASPAFISRCGILHVEVAGWRPYLLIDIINVDQFRGYQKLIYALFDWTIDPCLEFIHSHCTVTLALTDMHLVMSTLNLFKMYMENALEENLDKKEKDPKDYIMYWSQAALIMATNWALAGTLDFDSKQKFEEFYLALWNNTNENYPRPKETKQYEVSLPGEGKLRDNIYIFKGPGNWRNCGEIMKMDKTKEDPFIQDPFISTVNSIKLTMLFNLHLKNKMPFLLCGEYSSGKTTFFQNYFSQISKDDYVTNHFNFYSVLKSDKAQELFLSKLNKINRYKYGPSKNRYCIKFVDDLNAAAEAQSHANFTLELIRQYMDYGFWYDLKGVKKIIISNTLFAAALSTGRRDFKNVCPRFLRHFNVFSMYSQTKDNIFRIFSNKLSIDLKRNSFATDVLSTVNGITNATVEVYLAAVQNLKPTPTKVLYQFSLHDVQRIIKGCGLIHKESVETKVTFIRLWVHETFRVLGDRIGNDEDKDWLFLKIRESVKSCFKDPFESVFDYLPKYENDEINKESFKDLSFGNFMDADKSKRKYEELSSLENLKSKLLQYLKEHNESNERKIDLVVTCHTVEHLIRICRVLAIPGGNLLMVCSSGSGRKVLSRLASYIQQQSLFEPILDENYNEASWKEDLKSILMDCGSLKKDYVFLITDRQLKPIFLHDINSFLSLGEIPELFIEDEQREIVKSVRLDAQKGNRNLELDSASIFSYFFNECKQRLHFVLNISPIGKALQNFLKKYPKLIDQCTVNWFDSWPEKALEEVATHYVKDVNVPESVKSPIVKMSQHIYGQARQTSVDYYEGTGKRFYLTSSAFIRSIKVYVSIMLRKQEEIKLKRKRYLTGLEKLQLAAREVADMKNTLTRLRPQLEASARETEATMKEIENENVSVERATVLVKRDEEIANKKAEIAGILKAECEAELAVAIPILEDALAALNTLKPTDITLVKAMKNPPDTIKLVMAAVCVMLSVPSERVVDPVTGRKSMDFWGPSKRVLGDMNFLQNLKDYDKDNIAPAIMATIKKNYMSDKSFMPHIVAKASSAAEGLCKWVRAMVSYDEVAKVVAPKKEKLAAAQRECDETEAFLNAKRKTLADLNLKLSALKSNLAATLLKKVDLEKKVENCSAKLRKAEDLIASLAGEKTRWMDSSNKLGRLHDNLPGDVLLSSAMITYLSPLSLVYRERSVLQWKESIRASSIPFSEDYNFVRFLGKETKTNTWHLSGLSNNQFSLQNAIIMENSPLWCLFVDPQTQANEWIRNMEKANSLQVTKVTDSDFMKTIRISMEVGNPVLLENLEEVDVLLDPVLARDISKASVSWSTDLGQSSVLYKPSFRFYMTTRHNNPSYSIDVFNKVTVTDFLLPSDALRDRLLDIVISRERPELQEKFEKILVENINNKRILKQQEDNILHALSTCSTNILEDEGAIKILDASKSVAMDLTKRQEAAQISKEEIDAFRETYIQFTKYCADLYSTLNMLPNLNYMYRFSLSWFTQLYIKSIETSNRSVIHRRRIDYLKMSSIQNLHQSVHNALFEKHKLIYSFILCAKTLLDTEQVTEQEFNIFMSIGKCTKHEDASPNPASSWLPDRSWNEICRISNALPVFQSFASSFSTNSTKWRKYCTAIDCEDCLIPAPWDNKLTPFQKLIVIKILCPDKVILKISEFVESVMGQCSFAPCNITRPYAESSCLVPLIFILPSYSSPFAIVNKFAKILGFSTKLHSLSMGPAQEQKAELIIEMARKNGEWVFLHNCHLALPWMMKLEKMLESFDITNTSLGFRLWMSTQSNDKFPIGILQNSIKIAFDAPYDIKQTLSWTYKSEPIKEKEFFEGCPGKDKAFTKLLYGFCLFHAVIRERRNFGIQSWNFEYDFDESDLQMSIIQLKNWINQCDKVPYKALTYFLGECNYGGKIMDVQDKIYLDSLVADYCNYRVASDSNYDFDTVRTYRVPKRIEYRDYLKHIRNSIPAQPSPESFCLDKNVAIIKNSIKVKDFLNSLSSLNEAAVIPDIESKNNQVQLIVANILETIPENFNIKKVQKKYKVTEIELLNYVLIEEIKMYNKYLTKIRNSLKELKKAYDGYLIWTEELEETSEEILQGLVPKSWKLHFTLHTKKLSKFFSDFLERIKFVNNWIDNGHPRFYWFGGLMSCKRLLCAKKMIFAKEKQVPIDQVTFDFNVLELKNPTNDIDVPENSIYVYGLYLVGAKWNEQTKSLGDCKTKVFFNDMPVISMELTLKKNVNSINIFKCPLYITPNLHNSQCISENLLDNYILSVNLRSDTNPKIWTKRGTALYCQAE